jgi:hypothetical protein
LRAKIASVSEAATMIFSGGIDRSFVAEVACAQQVAIFNLQRHLENIQRETTLDGIILCDRGCLDELAYWPHSEDDFFKIMNTSLNFELNRYDAVIFLKPLRSQVKKSKVITRSEMNQPKKQLFLIKDYSRYGPNIPISTWSLAQNLLLKRFCLALQPLKM